MSFIPTVPSPTVESRRRIALRVIGDRSLRTKLVAAFLLVTALSIATVAVFIDRITRAGLLEDMSQTLSSNARQGALTVGDRLSREVASLKSFALSKLLQDEVDRINDTYSGTASSIQQDIQALDAGWTSSPDSAAIVQGSITNVLASELQEYQQTFPDNVEVLVTDKYGALAAATIRTTDYNQADDAWWQAAWNDGQGAVFIGQPTIDENTQAFSVQIAVPIYGHGAQEVVGILRTTYRLDTLLTMINAMRLGETGRAALVANGQRINQGAEPVPFAPAMLSQLRAASSGYVEQEYNNQPSFISSAVITSIIGEEVIENLDWRLLLHQDTSESLQPVNYARRMSLFISLGALFVAAIFAVVIAQLLSTPLNRLTHAAQGLATGELTRRVDIEQRDEIGTLATSFNAMAESLQARIAAEQAAQAEAQRLQQAAIADRTHLEQTVADYLAFTQHVASGDLTHRLQIVQGGALGQLGEGMNSMVENLRAMTLHVQEANINIARATAEILTSTTQQAASAAEQSAAITQTSTTIEEVKTIAQQTAEQATQVAHDTQAMLDVARRGSRAVEDTVSGMSHIKDRVGSIAETILALAEQTQAISTIITTVSEIADQSNLLALNAAIEAARAGEQGKSFAVVAQHVRELAERSKKATIQVREILSEIQRATNAAVLVTEEGTKGVDAGGKLANQAGQVIHRMALEVESGAQANMQMAAASQQQTAGMEQIGQAMTSIQQATTQALSSTRQAERAAQDLHALAQSLHTTIAAYRL